MSEINDYNVSFPHMAFIEYPDATYIMKDKEIYKLEKLDKDSTDPVVRERRGWALRAMYKLVMDAEGERPKDRLAEILGDLKVSPVLKGYRDYSCRPEHYRSIRKGLLLEGYMVSGIIADDQFYIRIWGA